MSFWETVVATALGASAPVAVAFVLRGIVMAARPRTPLEEYTKVILDKMNEGAEKMVEAHKRGEL